MNKCEKCGFLHYRTDPCRVAKKSTAPQIQIAGDGGVESAQSTSPIAGKLKHKASGQAYKTPAGVALPVDTNSVGSSASALKAIPLAGVGSGEDRQPIRKRGRPRTGFDKRAYNKQYMADRRAGKR